MLGPESARLGGFWLVLKRCFTSAETVGLLGTGARDVHLNLHTAEGLLWSLHLYTDCAET